MNPAPTFRDPAGSLRLTETQAIRSIHAASREAALEFIDSPFYQRLVQQGDVVATTIDDSPAGLTLIHPRIAIPTYPWEWTTTQWLAAANLTLSLCQQGLDEGWILKDATPLNILFDGQRPVLVDVLSFERRTPRNLIWLAHAQFIRTFLLTLVANKLLHWPLEASIFHRDGYEPADLYAALSWPQRLSREALWPITLPTYFEKRKPSSDSSTRPTVKLGRDDDYALYALKRTLASLQRRIRRAAAPAGQSEWATYDSTRSHYTTSQITQKSDWIRNTLQQLQPARVLDIGANTGEFSQLADYLGAQVVALERDAAAADRLYRKTASPQNNICNVLTIHADLSRPTPATGWANSEQTSLLSRLEGQFDLVLMLAVIHHLILMEQIPIPAILALAHSLTRRHLVIEWVPPTDPMFVSLMRGRTDLYAHLSEADLLSAAAPLFTVLERHALENGRVLFLFERT